MECNNEVSTFILPRMCCLPSRDPHTVAPSPHTHSCHAAANGWLVVFPEARRLWVHTCVHMMMCPCTLIDNYANFCIYFHTHFRHAIIHTYVHVHTMGCTCTTVEPLYKDTPEMRTSPFNQDTTYGPSYIEMCVKFNDPWSEDTSFNQDIWSCPKGVRNRGVPLYILC